MRQRHSHGGRRGTQGWRADRGCSKGLGGRLLWDSRQPGPGWGCWLPRGTLASGQLVPERGILTITSCAERPRPPGVSHRPDLSLEGSWDPGIPSPTAPTSAAVQLSLLSPSGLPGRPSIVGAGQMASPRGVGINIFFQE